MNGLRWFCSSSVANPQADGKKSSANDIRNTSLKMRIQQLYRWTKVYAVRVWNQQKIAAQAEGYKRGDMRVTSNLHRHYKEWFKSIKNICVLPVYFPHAQHVVVDCEEAG